MIIKIVQTVFIVLLALGIIAVILESYELVSYDLGSGVYLACIISAIIVMVLALIWFIIQEYTNLVERDEEE